MVLRHQAEYSGDSLNIALLNARHSVIYFITACFITEDLKAGFKLIRDVLKIQSYYQKWRKGVQLTDPDGSMDHMCQAL